MSEVKCSTCKGEKTLTFERGQRCVPCVTCSGSGVNWRKTCEDTLSQLAASLTTNESLSAELAWSENDSRDQSKELAALREELAKERKELGKQRGLKNNLVLHCQDLEQRLADAERRNSALSVLLREGLEESKEGDDWIDRVIAVLSWEASDTRELEHDRAYRNGLMQGYNLAVNGSEKEYQDAVLRYSGAALNKPEEAKS